MTGRVRTFGMWMWAAVGAALAGCGAEEAAPAPAYDREIRACPPVEVLAPTFLALVREERLPAVKALVGRALTDDQMSAILDGALRLVRDLSADELSALLRLANHPELSRLGPLLERVLGYLGGDGSPEGFRGEVVRHARQLVRTCHGGPLFTAMEALADAPELPTLLAPLGEALGLEVVQRILDPESGALKKPGFTVLVCNVLQSMTRPGFTVEQDIIRPLSGLPALPTKEPPLSTVLDGLAAMLDPAGPVFPPVRDLICCDLFGRPTCDEVPADATVLPADPVFTWLVYDLLVADAVQLDELLGLVGRLGTDPAVTGALAPVRTVLRRLGDDPDMRAALVGLLDTLLREEVARRVLPEIGLLMQSGALGELLNVVTAITGDCDPLREPSP